MAYRKHAGHDHHDEAYRSKYSPKHSEHLHASRYRDSRRNEPEYEPYSQPPGRRRWAAGYINKRECPNNPYIDTRLYERYERNRSPESDYITRPRSREDDYIQPQRDDHNYYTSHRTRHGLTPNHDIRLKTVRKRVHHSNIASRADGSDIEDLSDPPKNHPQHPDSNQEVGRDIASTTQKSTGSDVASIRSRRNSSRSDHRSVGSLGARSDVQDRRRKEGSESSSEDEGGYISLDEYIAGRSDCVDMSEEEGGEGSDAMGSDVGYRSDLERASNNGEGSDVANLSDGRDWSEGEDCISDGYENRNYSSHA